MPADYEFTNDIKYVSMQASTEEPGNYSGIKLLGPNREQIFDFIWSWGGAWTEF